MRLGGGFAGEVLGIELLEGGVDVVDVEREERRDPVVGVDLENVEHISVERLGPLVAGRETGMNEDEPLAAGRNDGLTSYACTPDVGGRPHDFDDGIGALSEAEIHERTAIVDGNVVG